MRAIERMQDVSETIKLKNQAKRYEWIRRLGMGGFAAAGAFLLMMSSATAEVKEEVAEKASERAVPERSMRDMSLISGSSEAAGNALTQSGLYRTLLPKQGDSIAIRYPAPLFSGPVSATSDPRALHVRYFGQSGEKMTINSLSGKMGSFHTYDRGTLWIPLWYVSEASAKTVSLAPQNVTLTSEAKLSLAPSSSVQWTHDKVSEAGQMVAIAKWNDWYGVILTPSDWHEGYEVYRPTLLWVRDKDVTSVKPVPAPLLGPDSQVSLDTIRGITELSLKLGDDTKTVQKLLGDPTYTESSEDLQTVVGDPMILGEAWRYERRDAHFTVTFSPSGKLARTHWTIPGKGEAWSRVYAGDDYLFSQDYSVTPLPQTLDIKPKWRNQGTLAFTYLLGAGKDTLLIKGDDGGYSGMHYDSSLYAVGRADGKTRWQVDAGFGVLNAVPESSGDYAYVYTSYNPAEQKYVNQVRRIRMSDGKTMWERKSGDEFQMGMWAVKKSVILVNWKDTGQEDVSVPSVLSVLDNETGKERWQRDVAREAQILNQGADDPYVLIRDNNKLEALDLMTGEPVWQIKAEGDRLDDPSFEPYFAGGPQIDHFAGPDSDKRWILVGDAWRLLDLKTGTSRGEYKSSPGERFEVLNERYLLIQHPLDNSDYWGATQFETRLYDVTAEKTTLTIPGKGSKGAIGDETLYLAVDGIPAAIDMKTGIYLWRMPNTAAEDADLSRYAAGSFAVLDHTLLFPYGSDLLIFDKKLGSVLGRLRDARMGYAELREQDHRSGTLNLHGDELYVGTANGGFFKYDVAPFTAMVQ
ncbi:putative pyrroloquinoline-quinone binding quinoprotein [Fontibacillus phaseoli]|uniref:Putative pyrroloquinoline-quinone binding quinoprotein n=1 Tax=Fontibacillus phaseoli TaxID=1416533 RepID=A0A369BLR8_9BACL|nr:PQQ-binding-like beta-propeller repeat protein [Fontibacillus phaseoli]RCX20644.1 putative pyrroloquinoline-quinone binding quinoprotein [Fontibacillus phaseoli]